MKSDIQNKLSQVYIFSGEDEYFLLQDAKNLVNKLLPPDEQTLGLEIIEAQARNAAEAGTSIVRCIEALRTPGFMGARKVVWLRNANFLDRGIIARSNEVTEILAALTALIKTGLPSASHGSSSVSHGLPKGNILIVTAKTVDKAAAFFKACHAKGETYQQEELRPWEKDKIAAAFARSILQKNKLQASQDVVDAIVDLVGTDSRQLSQEVNKLAVFIHPRQKASEEDVRNIVSSARESSSFNLADAVGFRDLPKAIAILRQLLFQKESEIGLVMGLESRFRYLLILKEMSDGKIADEGKNALESLLVSDKGRMPHEYFLKKMNEQARLFSRQELDSARGAILETRLKLVSSSGLEKILLEKLLAKLCGHQKPRSKLSAKAIV